MPTPSGSVNKTPNSSVNKTATSVKRPRSPNSSVRKLLLVLRDHIV